MITKFFATLAFIIILFGGTIAAADDMISCTVDHDNLPQATLTSDFGKEVLAFVESKDMQVFGTSQDKDEHFMIWYASDNDHACFLGRPSTQQYVILPSEECQSLYELGLMNGDYLSI